MKGKNVSVPQGNVIECNDSSSDSEASPRANKKSGGKPPTHPTFSKGGKGDQPGKSGGKISRSSSEPFIPSTPKINAKEELPKDAERLMDCEAAEILQGIQDQLVLLSQDSTIKLPRSFDNGLRYAKLGSHYTSSPAVKQVLETLKSHKVSDEEICLIANTCPETADELFALIPSLKENRIRIERAIKDVLSELAKLKSGDYENKCT
ncbi:hypothetical protein Scep_029023 [Stephania cephalantha]|uniref:RNA polymerase Rpb4/RPC9 core domain-containing protein n=1 Tax=Stephania cephalantha TaxID=152367 RepID=A0AAP0HMN1_9MAGN